MSFVIGEQTTNDQSFDSKARLGLIFVI